MQIKQVTTKKEWEDFLSTQDPSIYVQSWGYGEFNKKMGDDFVVIGIYKDEKIVGGAMFLEINARRGKFLYAPYSPILDYKDSDLMKQFFVQAKEIAKSRKIDFIRISPFEDDKDIHIKNLRKLGFKKAPMHMIAETTWILPLNDNEEDLLRNMKQNHRNLVRRADRDGVKVLTSKDTKDVAKIHELLVTIRGLVTNTAPGTPTSPSPLLPQHQMLSSP